ncbi:hypothetical protein [Catenulispora rubra]|uniref:hypothetical protein n=1 Tax=Catenulispora rubra TaxID=280293 RepID=UPI001891F887|nr:hypothetical protein [Catenulispora rubra]
MPDRSPDELFPAEYIKGSARQADGQSKAAGRQMTDEECRVALRDTEGLLHRSYSEYSQVIVAYREGGPILVAETQKRLQDYRLPKRDHERELLEKAEQVEAEVDRWLPHTVQFTPLLAVVSVGMDSALTELMAVALRKIRELPSLGSALETVESTFELLGRTLKALESAATEGDAKALEALPTDIELSEASAKFKEIDDDLGHAKDALNVMAAYAVVAGVQVAATFQAIARYIESRNAYLITFLEATDRSGEPEGATSSVVVRGGVIQGAYDAIATAVGQYAPIILPKIFTQFPLIGGGFAIFDVARTMNEKRKLVEERRRHFEELAEAHRARGDTDEVYWLKDRLKDDRGAVDELVKSTLDMCSGLTGLALAAQAAY